MNLARVFQEKADIYRDNIAFTLKQPDGIKELQAAVVSVYLKGAYQAWPRTSRFPRIRPIEVFFGAPLAAQELEKDGRKSGGDDIYQSIVFCIQKKVSQLQEQYG